ncbi:molecular chaperone DnaJ [bacterium]|nr:molecular chaperone DnaJ [bacterium]
MADYYDTLGVSRDATGEEIKRAFRKLARETHPDANPDDPDAEHRFREIAEAYEVLSDSTRRATYDRGGSVDMGDLFSSFGGIDDLLSRFFGAGFGSPFGGVQSGPAQGSDVGVRVEISLAEAAAGVARTVSYRAPAPCESCGGSGSEPGTSLLTCERCAGQGQVRVTRQTFLGTTMSIAACDACRGRGRVVVEPCETCGGAGSDVKDNQLSVDIPGGIEDGSRMRVSGGGAAGDAGGRSGDLFVEVRVTPDDRFERHGIDLVHRVSVGITEATLGRTLVIPTVDGGEIDLDVPPGTQPGAVFKLSGMGMPRVRRRGRGDLLVEVGVSIPNELDEDQEAALRAFAEAFGEEPSESRKRRRRRR